MPHPARCLARRSAAPPLSSPAAAAAAAATKQRPLRAAPDPEPQPLSTTAAGESAPREEPHTAPTGGGTPAPAGLRASQPRTPARLAPLVSRGSTGLGGGGIRATGAAADPSLAGGPRRYPAAAESRSASRHRAPVSLAASAAAGGRAAPGPVPAAARRSYAPPQRGGRSAERASEVPGNGGEGRRGRGEKCMLGGRKSEKGSANANMNHHLSYLVTLGSTRQEDYAIHSKDDRRMYNRSSEMLTARWLGADEARLFPASV